MQVCREGATFQMDDAEILIQMDDEKINKCKISMCNDNLVLPDGPVVIDWGAFTRSFVIDSY